MREERGPWGRLKRWRLRRREQAIVRRFGKLVDAYDRERLTLQSWVHWMNGPARREGRK